MIIDEYKTIFIHIPKTAGVSIEHAFIQDVTGSKTEGTISLLPNELKNRFALNGDQKHRLGYEYANQHPKKFNEYYKFAFVRNPWDRLVSEFKWRLTRQTIRHYTTFSEFLEFVQRVLVDEAFRKTSPYYHNVWLHVIPQYKYLNSANDTLIVDDVFPFNSLDANVEVINKKIGSKIKLKKHNSSNHEPYTKYYSNSSKKFVEEIYKKDIEMFDFHF